MPATVTKLSSTRKTVAAPAPPRISETASSLRIYVALIKGDGPLSVRELMEATGHADGTLYPILQKRISTGLIVDGVREGVSVYDLTPEGFDYVSALLEPFEIAGHEWMRARARYI